MATGRVNVFSRVRPTVAREDGDQLCVEMLPEDKTCVVHLEDGDAVDRVLAGGSAAPQTETKKYTFDGVFDGSCTQKEVYDAVGKPVLKDVLMGYNGSILAYGQTGAGKTHSLLNPGMGIDGKPDPKEAGLLPRLVAALFVQIGADVKHVYSVEASMLQIYNEQVDCLLSENREKAVNLPVKTGSTVQGLHWMMCKTPNDLLQCFQKGRNNLVYAETKMNKSSSRSHAVFQIKVTKRPRAVESNGKGKVEMKATFGKLTVVDLAGSERVKKSGVAGAQLKEAANINSSLLAFGNIVSALAEKKKFIPYRDSKLTRLLEDSVGGNCKTSLLVCASPSIESSDETVSTLEFASRASRIETTATVNEATVCVDEKSLMADLAGDGLDTALKEKHSEMMALESKMKNESKKRDSEIQRIKEEASKKEKAEAAKAAEAGKLLDKWRLKAEEATKKITDLEMKVKDSAAAKEAKVAQQAAEAEVVALKSQLTEARAAAAAAAEVAAGDLRGKVAALQVSLEETSARAAAQAARADDAERRADGLCAQLAEKSEALRAAHDEAAAMMKRAAEEKDAALLAAEEDARAGAEAAAAAARAEAEVITKAGAEEARREAETQRSALAAEWRMRLADAEAAAARELSAAQEEAAAVQASRDKTIKDLEAVARERDAQIHTLKAEAGELQGELASTKSALVAKEAEMVAEVARLESKHAAAVAAMETKFIAAEEAARQRAAAAEEDHQQGLEALAGRAELKGRRLSWAFSASRALLEAANTQVRDNHELLRARFDARESREDDLARISHLNQSLNALQHRYNGLEAEAKQLTLRLDNRNASDAVFGKDCQAHKKPGSSGGALPIIRPKTAKATNNSTSVPARHAAAAAMGYTGGERSASARWNARAQGGMRA